MNHQFLRNPRKEILKKIIIGTALSLLLIIFYFVTFDVKFSLDAFGLMFFLIGGIFFVIGGIRDFLGSFLVRGLRGGEPLHESDKESHLYGFGRAGEDVIAGAVLIFLALLCWTVGM